MPEAVKEGGGAGAVAAPEDAVQPPMDLPTDGAVEVKPPPATEPSLPVDQVQQQESDSKMEEVGETAPEVKEPPTEQSGSDKTIPPQPTESISESEVPESDPKDELAEMITKGRGLLTVKGDCYAAAEVLSKACEKASEIYGELSEHCSELYYLYGCSMLECGKSENNVLGESMKDKDTEEAVNEDEDDADDKSEAMEVDETEGGPSTDVGTSNGATVRDKTDGAEDVTKPEDEEEEDDSSLKVAWEMFEMAKVAFTRLGTTYNEKLADTLMKLGEVGIESGHPSAMEDMLAALDMRQKLFPNKRIIPETHFNIGLAYSMFEMFDEAIIHFEKSKTLLEEMATNLQNMGDEQSVKEAKEIRDILPDLKDKIQDMIDSKKEKRREMEEAIKNGVASGPKENGTFTAGTSSEANKPASNITHLIKRKRKIDEVTSDLPNKAVEEPKRKVKAVEKEAEIEPVADETKKPTNLEGTQESIQPSCKAELIAQEEPMETEEEANTSHSVEQSSPITSRLESEQTATSLEEKSDSDKSHPKSSVTVEQEPNLNADVEIKSSQITKPTPDEVIAKESEQTANQAMNLQQENKTQEENIDVNKLEVVKPISKQETNQPENISKCDESKDVVKNDSSAPETKSECNIEPVTNEANSTLPNKQNDSKDSPADTLVQDDNKEEQKDSVNIENNVASICPNITTLAESSTVKEVPENETSKLEVPSVAEPDELRNESTGIKSETDIADSQTKNESASIRSTVDHMETKGESADSETITGGPAKTNTEHSEMEVTNTTRNESALSETITGDITKASNDPSMEVVNSEDKTDTSELKDTISTDKKLVSKTVEMIVDTKTTTEPAETEAAMEIVDKEVVSEIAEMDVTMEKQDKPVEMHLEAGNTDEKGSMGTTEIKSTVEDVVIEASAAVTELESTKKQIDSQASIGGTGTENTKEEEVSVSQSKDENLEKVQHEDMETSTEVEKEAKTAESVVTSDVSEVKSGSEINDVGNTTTETETETKKMPVEEAVKTVNKTDDHPGEKKTDEDHPGEKKTGEVEEKEPEKMIVESSSIECLTTQTSENKEAAKPGTTIETPSVVSHNIEKENNESTETSKSPEDVSVNCAEESSDPSITSKNSSEQDKVTNGCTEKDPLENVETNLETVGAKELNKDTEEPTSVAAE